MGTAQQRAHSGRSPERRTTGALTGPVTVALATGPPRTVRRACQGRARHPGTRPQRRHHGSRTGSAVVDVLLCDSPYRVIPCLVSPTHLSWTQGRRGCLLKLDLRPHGPLASLISSRDRLHAITNLPDRRLRRLCVTGATGHAESQELTAVSRDRRECANLATESVCGGHGRWYGDATPCLLPVFRDCARS